MRLFFLNLNAYLRKNVYSSIIQSIAHLKLWLFPMFLAICGFHPKRTAPAWRPRMNQANFWYPVLRWTVFQWGRSASTGTNGSQKSHIRNSHKWLLLSSNRLIVFSSVLHWCFHPVLAAHNTAHPSDPTKYRALPSRHGYSALPFIWMQKWLLFVAF